ncbi:MAG: septum formation initiator family protein, partial [Kutzneria sp.]|nr:septum formation initiator family protein [Kutzneria sp.]
MPHGTPASWPSPGSARRVDQRVTGREDGEGRGPRGKDISPRRRTARVPVPSARGRIRARSGEGTGGAFGLSITRRAALLALVVGALALTVAVPLRTYLTQHAQVQQELNRQAELKATEQQLERRESQLSDPAHVEAEARQRLRMVMPGE